VIDRFPDHMHEGEVVADDDVKLDQLFNILDYERPEYPFVIPTVLGSAPLEGELPTRRRPRPHVIAYGRTTNPDFVPPILERVITGDHPLRSKRFGLISAYDGDSVGLGRVVVDSTWHHWFSMNLVGIAQGDSPAYQKMQDYYRNVGMWLATPAQRSSMLVSGTWGVLNGSPPMAFGTETEPWEIGERVLAAFGLTASPCLIREIVAPFLDDLELLAESSAPGGPPQAEPSWSGLPEDLINRALVGGIGSALLDLALDHQEKRARGQRPRVNPEAIRQRIVDGVARGHTLLRKSVQDAATSLTAVHAVLTKSAIPRPIDVRIPIEVRELRVVAETLQLPDASDPVLLDRHVTLTIRLKLDDSIVAHQIIESVELPAFNERGSVIDLSRDVAALAVQTGESLSIEVIAGSWTSEEADPELIRFTETLRGDASKWIGKNLPARSQAWRLWYRIEEAKAPSY
jgi:hypothetical protein